MLFRSPVKNDTTLVNRLNGAIGKLLPTANIITHSLPMMGSEDFPMLIINSKTNPVYDYLWVGIANPQLYKKATKEGKEFPFYNHNPNFEVDLSAIPFGTMIGATALIEMFKK